MARALVALFAAPFIVYAIFGVFGYGAIGIAVTLALAGALGGLVAWFAFGTASDREDEPTSEPTPDTSFIAATVEMRVLNGHATPGRNSASAGIRQRTLIPSP
jgi:hypothetical protein